ncbi:MAG: hypothetical protein ACM3JP_02500, partial [Betaproteobacteria bacterium]
DYLREHPGDHAKFVSAIDRTPVSAFPYGLVNARPTENLAIAFAFPPYVDTSAFVMAKRLRMHGRVVDVVSNAMDRARDVDETAARIAGPFVARQSFLNTPSRFDDWATIEEFALAGQDVIRRWEVDQGAYATIYSRAHFAASHFLAALHKLARPSVTWTAEFSDPLSRDIHGRERGRPIATGSLLDQLRTGLGRLGLSGPRSQNLFVWGEELAYRLADELVFTNDNQLNYMLRYCGDRGLAESARAKAVVRPQPSLPPEFYRMVDSGYPIPHDVVNIAYFGKIYATRGLDEVLAAVAGADLKGRLILHTFTGSPREIAKRASELGIQDSVRANRYKSYLEFLNLTTKFDYLLVNDAASHGRHESNPYLPSKWSDYRGGGRPVWGLIEPGSALSRESLEYSSPLGDIAAARDVLAHMVEAGRPSVGD